MRWRRTGRLPAAVFQAVLSKLHRLDFAPAHLHAPYVQWMYQDGCTPWAVASMGQQGGLNSVLTVV